MPGLEIEAHGLKELKDGLASARRDLGKEQRKAYKEVGDFVAKKSQAVALRGTPAQRRFAKAIRGRSTTTAARVAVVPGVRLGGAAATFFGAKPLTRSGWNARGRRTPGMRPQFPEWVGNTWTVGKYGEGPYVINSTIVTNREEIDKKLRNAPLRALHKAFPDGES